MAVWWPGRGRVTCPQVQRRGHTKSYGAALSLLIDENERKQPKSNVLVTDLMFPYIYLNDIQISCSH